MLARSPPAHLTRARALITTAQQRVEAYQESLRISAAIFSAVRRCPILAKDPNILPTVLKGCCSENALAARHAFAILVDQATHAPDLVSQVRRLLAVKKRTREQHQGSICWSETRRSPSNFNTTLGCLLLIGCFVRRHFATGAAQQGHARAHHRGSSADAGRRCGTGRRAQPDRPARLLVLPSSAQGAGVLRGAGRNDAARHVQNAGRLRVRHASSRFSGRRAVPL